MHAANSVLKFSVDSTNLIFHLNKHLIENYPLSLPAKQTKNEFEHEFVLFIYLPHIINYTITITKRYKIVESNGEEA